MKDHVHIDVRLTLEEANTVASTLRDAWASAREEAAFSTEGPAVKAWWGKHATYLESIIEKINAHSTRVE